MDLQNSGIDALTGLPAYAGLRSALKDPVPAIFLDIDGFRFVNHFLDHRAGDEVLSGLGAWLQRESEALQGPAFRVAGDEFLLLLPGRTLDEAAAIAARLVATCPTLPLPHVRTGDAPDAPDGITLSAVVFQADRELPERLRDALDELAEELYQRELASGRAYGNLVVVRPRT